MTFTYFGAPRSQQRPFAHYRRHAHGPDRDYLQLFLAYSPAQITSSGLDKQVAAADERFQRKLDQTLDLLSKYDLSRADLEAALRSALNKNK